MILMIDDVKMVNAETFFPYVSKALGYGSDGIINGDRLYDVLSECDDEVEIILHDYDKVPEESRKFAKDIVSLFMDVRVANKKVSVEFVNNDDYKL